MTLQEDLQSIGFTEYEAKTYLALLKDHPATGYQISKSSGVPRSMVYEALGRLHSRGAVLESIEGRTTLYRPLNPEILLSEHQQSIQSLIDNLKPGLNNLFSSTNDHRVWSITDLDTIFAYSKDLLHRAKKEIFLVLNDYHHETLAESLDLVEDAGIVLNILATGQKPITYGNAILHPPLESEIQGLTHTLLILIDNTEVLIANTSEDSNATITANSNLIMIAKQFIWMEFFTQRIYTQLGEDLLARLDPKDKEIFTSMIHPQNDKE
ncbi:MAG: helix-turn-helix domain-containing protein [Anaerolineales bacterium]